MDARSHPRHIVKMVTDRGELGAVLRGKKVVALTGAGVSTESGIPDYRSPEAAKRVRRPIHGPEFLRSSALRHRYWARAMAGWETFRRAQPSASHKALAELEEAGVVSALITQNVDRLHHKAGSERIIELHGALAEVVCLACGALESRDHVQARMQRANPTWLARLEDVAARGRVAPDGDADLTDEEIASFTVPSCERCEGALKPRVVFFGENVPRDVVDQAFALVDGADALLVAGTSLAVFSGYRFLRRAAERKIPIVIVNRGPVRGEEHAAVKIEASTGETLAALAAELRRDARNESVSLTAEAIVRRLEE
jgi:NAD-dependent SIR2 family protein deacetylase